MDVVLHQFALEHQDQTISGLPARLVSHPVQNCRDLLRFFYHRSMLLVWRDFLGVAVTVITPAVTQFGSNACLRS